MSNDGVAVGVDPNLSSSLCQSADTAVVPVELVESGRWESRCEALPAPQRRWALGSGFRAKPGTHCPLPDPDGGIARVLVGVDQLPDPWCCAEVAGALPAGAYRIEGDLAPEVLERIAMGWGLGHYRFRRYKHVDDEERALATLVVEDGARLAAARAQIDGIALARDLINTPAEDMMPEDLSASAAALARQFDARFTEVVGEDLLSRGYPAIHAVGRASDHPPRLLDLSWGPESAARLTLVGKGVCFDSGGLDLKSASGMRLMKKDMGGAANALGLARMIMETRLPVRLRVLVPAVENAVSARSYRPGDVVATRAGINIEIENTDAEGRVVLSDALAEGGSEQPALMLDFATLTGAARIALGTDLPALFTNDDDLAAALAARMTEERDPLWRLPLHRPYRELIESRIADISNSTSSPHGGAITAALFLERFVPEGVSWAHLDLMAWNTKSRPGRPEGGEAMGMRTLFAYLRQRFTA